MNKTKKLLSVILAVIMALSSLAMLSSANFVEGSVSKLKYDTVADLENIGAYDGYGRATRFTTDERLSVFYDFLDQTLYKANINPGTVLYVDIKLTQVSLTLDFRSLNKVCWSMDNIANLINDWQKTLGGTINTLWFKPAQWERNMSRENIDTQGKILFNLVRLLNKNAQPVGDLIRQGYMDWGLILKNVGAIKNLTPTINGYLGDVPGLVKGMIFPMLARWDDDLTRIKSLGNKSSKVGDVLQDYVNGMLKKNVSIVAYYEPVGSETPFNLKSDGSTRCNYVKGQDTFGDYIERQSCDVEATIKDGSKIVYAPNKTVNPATGQPTERFYAVLDAETNRTYYRMPVSATKLDNPDWKTKPSMYNSLTYYLNGTPALHSMYETEGAVNVEGNSGASPAMYNLSANSAADLLYNFIPYLFEDFACVAANGSLKKEMAWLFGGQPSFVGAQGSPELAADLKEWGVDETDTFFTKEQEVCVYDYSDFKSFASSTKNDKVYYWRYLNDYYRIGTGNINPYFNIINWDYKLDAAFLNEFLPGNAANVQGYDSILRGLNNILGKALRLIVKTDSLVDPEGNKIELTWLDGDNSLLVDNIINTVQALFKVSPKSIFGSNYNRPERYYDLIMTEGRTPADKQKILLGAAGTLIPMVMPQIDLPSSASLRVGGANADLKIGAILAAVVRELATQFVPEMNYDALIYSDYNTKTFVSGKDNAYWLDVALTIGMDIAYKYVVAVLDLGEEETFFADATGWVKTGKTYSDADLTLGGVKLWEARLDYLVDIVLCDKDYGFKFANILDTGKSATQASADLATPQDPFLKLETVIKNIVCDTRSNQKRDTSLYKIINIDAKTTGWLKDLLVNDIILGIADLNLTGISGTGLQSDGTNDSLLFIPASSVLKQKNVLNNVVLLVRDLLNGLLRKVSDNQTTTSEDANLLPMNITTLDDSTGIFNQNNMAAIVQSLLDRLYHAYNNGLLDPVLCFLNILLGQKTTGQNFSDPLVKIYDTATEKERTLLAANGQINGTIEITNDIAGMLLKHRVGENDKEKLVYIDGVTFKAEDGSNAGLTATGATGTVGRWQKKKVTFSGSFTKEQSVQITVEFHVTGINGNQIGGSHKLSAFVYLTDNNGTVPTDAGEKDKYIKTSAWNHWALGLTRNPVYKYFVYNDALSAVNGIENIKVWFLNSSHDNDFGMAWITKCVASGLPAEIVLNTPFVKFDKMPGSRPGSEFADPEKTDIQKTGVLKSGQTGGFAPIIVSDNFTKTYGAGTGSHKLPLGNVTFTWHNNQDCKVGFGEKWDKKNDNNLDFVVPMGDVYILNNDEVIKVFNQYKNLREDNFVEGSARTTAWGHFVTAMNNAAKVVLRPFKPANFADYSEQKYTEYINAIKAAVEELEACGKVVANADKLNEVNTWISEGLKEEDNYQDFELQEFFKYQSDRNDTRWRIEQYNNQPAASIPEYIPGIPADKLEAVRTEAQKSGANYLKAVNATVYHPTDEEQAAQLKRHNAWKAPTFSDFDNDNLAENLRFRKGQLVKLETKFEFLNKEIALAKPLIEKYASAKDAYKDYSQVTWDPFQTAYDNAVAMAANPAALRHEVFEAKYNLMLTYKQLIPTDLSCIATGKYNALNDLIAKATEILGNTSVELAENVPADMTLDKALGQLIKARGYYANGVSQLYSDSAQAFVHYDRIYSDNEGTRIQAKVDALNEAIALFKVNAIIEGQEDATQGGTSTGTVESGFISGITVGAADITKFFKPVGEGKSLNVVANAKGANNGTGAKIEVLDGTGKTIGEFTLVVYGDVDGDGAIDGFDAVKISGSDNSALNDAQTKAADITASGAVEAADYAALKNVVKGAGVIDQSTGQVAAN